jgi:hypothetical protein
LKEHDLYPLSQIEGKPSSLNRTNGTKKPLLQSGVIATGAKGFAVPPYIILKCFHP